MLAAFNCNQSFTTDLATVCTKAISSERFAPNQNSVLPDSVGRLQQGLHAERHCLHTLSVPVPLEQGTVQ